MGKQSARKHPDAEGLSYAKEWLTALRERNPDKDGIHLDLEMIEAILVDFIAMKEAARRRRGRAPHRPHENKLGKAVVQAIKGGLSESAARQAVAQETGKYLKTVSQAHRRLLQLKLPSLHRRK